MTTSNDVAETLQGEALPDPLPKSGGTYSRLPNGRVVPLEAAEPATEITTPTAVPAADPETVQED
ncbi:hypothetical protein HPT27_10590 [Permianibacter sp. IMCC34836]|uniref:hypothetical protein n=1 Tax=Permianibacter fluminis TaxID=2738515 RepID=UPI0015577EA8|nr:hypothetical protein [Permianibacter fluminis]NQD37475.1 hypothetical protein [Permianibacter fluminis]